MAYTPRATMAVGSARRKRGPQSPIFPPAASAILRLVGGNVAGFEYYHPVNLTVNMLNQGYHWFETTTNPGNANPRPQAPVDAAGDPT